MTQFDAADPVSPADAADPDARGDLRQLLRSIPVFAGVGAEFDPRAVPADPSELFVAWLRSAVRAGVREPHAMTLATVGADGVPSSRVLICKDVSSVGWSFATDARSRKGRELESRPVAAASFYWPEQGRQVRVVGHTVRADRETSAADFLARSSQSRAAAFASRTDEPLASLAQLAGAFERSRAAVETRPGVVLDSWVVYTLVADEVEFFQGAANRQHVRVRYERGDDVWEHALTWP